MMNKSMAIQTAPKQAVADLAVSRLLFALCWLAYAASYVGRLSYSAALAGMIESGLFSKAEGGLIGTVFFFCYGGGQLINGYLGDRISPFKMIGTGLFLSCIANFCMFCTDSYAIMLVFWGINGIANSMLWSPILYILVHTLAEEHRTKACLHIASTVPCGTIAAYAVSMTVMKFFSYRSVFLASSAVMIIVAVLWQMVAYRTTKTLRGERAEWEERQARAKECAEKSEETAAENPVQIGFFQLLLRSGVLFLLLPIMLHGMLNIGISTWVPAMITEIYTVTPAFSLLLSMLLPIINLSGAFLCTHMNDKIFHNEVKTVLVFFAFAIPPICVLLFIGSLPVFLCVLMLAMVTTAMLAVNHLLITLIPFRLAKFGRASTMTGFLNATAYAGCALSNYGFGFLADSFGWNVTIVFWIGIVAVSIVFCLLTLIKWTPFMEKREKNVSEESSE